MNVRTKYKSNKPKSRVVAEEEVMDIEEETFEEERPTELLFEATDVADLLAEISGEEVEMEMDEDVVIFHVGDTDYTIEPEGDEEILEAVRKPFAKKAPVAASKTTRKPAPKATKPANRRK